MKVVIALSAMMISCLLAACPTRYCRVRPSNADTCCSVSHAAPLRRIIVLLSLRKGSKIPRKNKSRRRLSPLVKNAQALAHAFC